jgi:putative Ig domain-containing protein/VCBS repeat protein/Kelch motif protein
VPSITTTSFADAYTGQAYSATAAGTGGKLPYTWTVTAGALPAGLTLNAGSGAISGSPSGTTQTFTLTLADANGVLASQPFTLAVFNQPAITTPSPLPDGYASSAYALTFAATGGKAPLTWQQTAGTLPPGLTLSSGGVLGNAIGAAGQAVPWNFTVSVTDANGRVTSSAFQLTTYVPPSMTVGSLTTATEGVTYLRAPATPEQVTASNGKPPLTFSAIGLPAGIGLAPNGIFSGIPAQGTAGPHPVTFTATDANGKTGSASASLQVNPAAPLYGGGTVGVAPSGSPITDTLTVFTTDYEGRRYPNLAVRIRKNGVEYAPVKEQVTDAGGKAVFTGLGLNGTTDTVDVTVNGKDVANESFLKVNAAIISVPLLDYPVPVPRAYANGELDPATGKLIVTGGVSAAWYGLPSVNSLLNGSVNDVLRLSDSTLGTWVEDLPPGMANAPSPRFWSGMAYAGGVHVLFGGMEYSNFFDAADTWTYSTATSRWTQVPAGGLIPSPRDQMAMAGIGSQVYLFGGESGGFSGFPLNDLFSFDPTTSTWSAVPQSAPAPSARFNAGATSAQNKMWICGGSNGTTELSDCWSFDPPTLTWQSRGALSTPRQGVALAATSAGAVYAFGGTFAGVTTNELMVSAGGTFVTVSAANPPPAREGAVLAYETSTGRLIMFGGVSGTFAFSDVWTFDPVSSAWTQRTQTWNKAAAGFTLSGNITNGAGGTRSRVMLEASGLSGYTNRKIITLTNGSAPYTMTGIPAGDTISLTALNEDLSLGLPPNREWSWLDLGVISNSVTGNLVQNVTLPSGPMSPQLITASGSYALPSGWKGESFDTVLSRLARPGFANHPNGAGQLGVNRTYQSYFFPPLPGGTETLVGETESLTAANCEFSTVWTYNVNAGPLPLVTYPPGPRSLSPGLSGCTPAGTGLVPGNLYQQSGTSGASGAAVRDMDGDGFTDVVLLDDTQVLIWLGSGSGEGVFDGPIALNLPASPGNSLAIADLDKNGLPDLVVGLGGTTQFAVFLQTAPDVYSFATSWNAGTQVRGLAVGDFNGDTNQDVVVMGPGAPSQLTEVTGLGNGSFNGPTLLPVGGAAVTAVVAADLNGDAFTDVAYAQGAQLGFLRGALGTLQNAGTLPLGAPVVSLAAGDLDGDGVNDLAAGMEAPNMVQVELNRSNFSFIPGGNVPLSSTGAHVAIGELTGDSLKDVVVATQDQALTIFRGIGAGNLTNFYSTVTYASPGSITTGDFNSDGNADVVVGENLVSFYPTLELFAAKRPIPAGTDAYSFTAPANTRMFFLDRGPSQVAWDAEMYSRAAAGTVTTSFPLPSTLRPSRPTPVGQLVHWSPTLMITNNPANANIDSFSNSRVQLDAETSMALLPQYRR